MAQRPVIFAIVYARRVLFGAALFVIPALMSFAEDALPQVERLKSSPVLRHLKQNPISGEAKSDAERTIAQIYVPEGFKVEVIAAEPDVRQPIAFAWDERGRIWVAEAFSYPTKRSAGEGLDRIIILADEDGDGRFESRKVFAEKLNLVSGLEIGHGGVWVGAAPELLFIPDRNRDDKPDGPPEVLLDGFGFQDTHETLNSFLWGPDGWLYGIQGVFNTARIGRPGVPAERRPELRAGVWRFHPVRREFEIFAHGGSNPWGLDYDEHGQLFMTHCRSYWGRGLTTHVIQGGQFWNQVNANYAPFIIANAPKEFPGFRNFLLASARYDHGAGGAGVRGSDAIYGGHSHVGTMIYLGDNWPDEYRGRLFTHNLGGHQINQQINEPLGSGYNTVHAGRDVLFCTDPKYVAIDLQYGPDGAVYFIDWYDQQHCHNPNTERWDRGNGRVYRMQWQADYKPVKTDLSAKSDAELVALLSHKNAWFGRTARRLLHERAQSQTGVAIAVKNDLRRTIETSPDARLRLESLWALHLVGGLTDAVITKALADQDQFVRAWAIHLAADDAEVSAALSGQLVAAAKNEPSPVVRRYLASAIQRVPSETAWRLIEGLSQRGEDKDDRNLPYLLWHGVATRWPTNDLDRAFAVARKTELPQLADWIYWFAATHERESLDRVVNTLGGLDGAALHRRLAGLWLAMEPRANVPMPAAWNSAASRLYESDNVAVQRLAEKLAAGFGDAKSFPRLRTLLADSKRDKASREHAFAVLSRAQDRGSLPVFLALLDDNSFRTPAINVAARFDSPEVAAGLIQRFSSFNANDRAAALTALTSRPSFALLLLDAVGAGKLPRNELTSFHVRQLTTLKSADVDKRVASMWGRIGQTPVEKQNQIAKLEKTFNEAPLWAYSGNAGRQHFQKLCASCHKLGNEGTQLGPELTGAGKHGVRYFLENVIDPDAVIGADFQMTTIDTKDDETLSGLLVKETASAVTLRTTVGETVVPKATIKTRGTSEKSLMPEGLLDSLAEREQIELLKFLTTN
ncbi:MAG TPA: PVC-type heme-binding CxxCH protein [Candidatus Acidoferrum sp.]|nr:PVC-type heme-binding CxxCH protein [Candidatus Acidoferrum sp.]